MAGVKVTDLNTLGAAASDDVMYIVETSTNTSKQIEVQDIYSGMPQFESGAFTPVPSNESNCSVTFDGGIYSRVGDIVTMSFAFNIQLDVGADGGAFNFSLPIATTFSTRYECCGSANINTPSPLEAYSCIIESDTGNPALAKITFDVTTDGLTLDTCRAVVQYQIL
jgi:hypothetical protein